MSELARVPTELASRERNKLFASFLDVWLVLDSDGPCLRIAGDDPRLPYRPPSELLGKTLHEIFPVETADLLGGHVRRVIEEGRLRRAEYSLSIGGAERWFEGIVAPASTNSVLWIARDITEFKQAENQLKRQLRFTELITHSLGEGLFVLGKEGRVSFANPAAERMLGWKRSEMEGRELHSLVHFQHSDGTPLPASDCPILNVLETGRTAIIEADVFTRRDGSTLPVAYTVSAIVEDGETSGLVLSFQDVSGRRAMEERLRQSTKMEAVGRLAAGVAHDFNNTLSVVAGYADLLLCSRTLPEKFRIALEQIRKASDQAAALTRQLLAFSRRQNIRPRVLNLNSAIIEMAGLTRQLLGEDIELSLSLMPGLWWTKADPGQIEQIILNLATNARDAMTDGGVLTIETTNATIDGSEGVVPAAKGRYVMLTVRDTGCGMPVETQSHIFEPFFTTKEPGKGTGLGLATVWGIVKQAGGEITVSSEPRQGSLFRVFLPAVNETVDGDPPTTAPVLCRAKAHETLLLTENDAPLRRLMSDVLRLKGYRVLEAADGIEAVALFKQHERDIDLLITDLALPKMTGRELGEIIQSQRPGIRVLYTWGGGTQPISGMRTDEGPGFLRKPFTPEALTRKLRQALDASGPGPEAR